MGDEAVQDQLKRPDWRHWSERGVGMVWYGVLLSMNLHPSRDQKEYIKNNHVELYTEYKRRLEIATCRLGLDLFPITDHLRAGDGPSGQYVEFSDILEFAVRKNWSDVEHMQAGLRPDQNDLVMRNNASIHSRVENNYLRLIKLLLSKTFDEFDSRKTTESAKAILAWCSDHGLECPVNLQTLEKYISKINALPERD